MADKSLRFNIFTRDANTKKTLAGIADAAEEADDGFKEMARGARKLDGELDGVAGAAEEAGDGFKEMARDARKLDSEVEDLQRQLVALARQMSKDIDADQFKDLRKQLRGIKADLRDKIEIRKLIDVDEAKGIGAKLADGLNQGIVAAGPLKGGLIAGAVGAAPVVSSVVAAAVTGGVALATVGAGLKIAFSDPAVKAAGSDLAGDIGASMKDAAAPFVPATLNAIGIVRREFHTLRPDLNRIFAGSAEFVEPLTMAVVEGAREMSGSLAEVVENADPVVEVLGEHIPRAADAAGQALEKLSQDSKTSASALDGLLTVGEGQIAWTSSLVSWLGKASVVTTPWLHIVGGLSEKTAEAAESTAGFSGWLGEYTSVASKSAWATMTLAEQVRELSVANNEAFGAETRLGEAIAQSTEKKYRNKDAVRTNTEAGRDNRDMLQRLAAATLASRDAVIAQTNSAVDGERVMQRGYNAFIRSARAMGISEAAARDLARELGLIPPAKNVAVNAHTKGATAAVQAVQNKIAELRNKNVYITGTVKWTHQGLKVPGGIILERAEGGIVPGPPVRRDIMPALLTPGEGIVNLDGMRRIGGEAGLNAINKGTGRAPASAGMTPTTAPGGPGTADIARSVERAIERALGRVTVMLDGRRVGEVQGRQADLYARGG